MHILFLGYKVSDSLNPVKCFLVHLQFWVFFTWNFSKHPLSITQENFALFPLHIHFMSLLFCSALLALPPLGVFHRPVCHPFTVHIGRCFPFPGSAKCSNRRLSCILKLICVLVISRPLHVLILWFEDYFMHIYAFTTAKSTRNHTTKTSTTFWLTTGGVLHPQLISPININLICGIHRYI